jgi:hypothetical protein
MRPEGEYEEAVGLKSGEAVGFTRLGVAVAVITMISSSRVRAYKGLQAEAINRNPPMTKSFLWIIVLPYLSLSLSTKPFSLSKSL